jgi:hypothetical protein
MLYCVERPSRISPLELSRDWLMPEDIETSSFFTIKAAIAFFGLAAMLAMPVGLAIYHSGIRSIVDWPELFNWLSAGCLASGLVGRYFWSIRKTAGASVRFREDGFTIRLKEYVRAEAVHDLNWSEIREIAVISAAYDSDSIVITADSGLKIGFPMRFVLVHRQEAFRRLRQSAENAGYRLERSRQFQAFIVGREVWSVVPGADR